MKPYMKRLLSLCLIVVMVFGMLVPAHAAEAEDYDWQGQWIWTSDAASEGQWINLRKTFTLNEVPETVEARISVDTKYWMWINGEMAVYEGQLKTGPSMTSWYYDCEDIARYLVKGENTIAVLAWYAGRDSFSTKKTGNQAFLFDAEFPAGALADGTTRLVSDASWKVMRDAAYETPDYQPNYRVGATNIKYNAAKEQTGWQNPGFDDSKWANATVKTMSASDPRNTLALRSIPQWKVDDLITYTADGENKYTVKKGASTGFSALSLPESYVVTGEFYAETPPSTGSAAYGISVCMKDGSHFYMPQVSLYEYASKVDYIRFKPHIWNGGASAYNDLITNRSDVVANEDRYNVKHTVKVEVDADSMTVHVDGQEFGSVTDTTLARTGASIGLRQSSSEKTRLYSLKVEDTSGNLLWEDNISEAEPGDTVNLFQTLSGTAPVYKEDENGDTYLYVNNCIIVAGEQTGTWSKLSLPEEYTVSGTFKAMLPSGATSSSVGLSVCMSDAQNFYMPQVSLKEGSSYEGLRFKPHKMQGGGWTTYPIVDHSSLIPTDRYTTKMAVEMKVDAEKIVVSVNGTEFGTMTNTDLARIGNSIGFRQSSGEHTAVYDLQITDANGKIIWKDDIGKTAVGATPAQFKVLTGGTCQVRAEEDGTKYLYLNNTICTVGQLEHISVDTYSFKNPTNMQGTPYLKVRSTKGGETIFISSDSTAHTGGESVVHWYVTKAGEQEWEAMGWMNGWQIDFDIPSTVEVLELGFRKSGYATEVGGVASTSNASLNQLYQEAYDTLDITMRDTYMDCPDRERCQWWGDAVNEMQQAAYAMDHDARLLYKKTLTQVVGWSAHKNGPLTTVVATPTGFSELPMQSLAGVHSLWQYYLYYGETDILEYCYDAFMKFLRLWTISDNGVIAHRGGNWDWMDWGDHPDVAVIESSWYYVAAENMIRVAQVLGKDQADIDFLENQRTLLKENFASLYWDETRGAYYSTTTDGKADDRGNAMAVYSGLADPQHYPQLLNVFQTIEKASPYMEKYVLEAMYMMGYDEEAVTRTLKRYDGMLKDGYPTLYEYWAANKLSGNGGTGTRNHAWTGAPLSMMYMFNAGITPTDAGFKTFQVRPMLGSLTHAEAYTDTVSGTISVDVTTDTLTVTVPSGSESALICVPKLAVPTTVKLGDAVVYDNGAPAATLPAGVAYTGEDVDYVNFAVTPGTYAFTTAEDAADAAGNHTITVNAEGSGTVAVNGQTVTVPYTYTGSGEVTIVATPAEGSRTMAITGSYPETVISQEPVTRTYTLDCDMTWNVSFADIIPSKLTLTVTDTTNMPYAANTYVNGKPVTLPYAGAFAEGEEVTIEMVPVEPLNYETVWGEGVTAQGSKAVVTMTQNTDITVGVQERACVSTLKIAAIEASDSLTNTSWGKEKAIDGSRVAVSGSNGYSSNAYTSTDISDQPITLTLDLGAVEKLNQLSLFPRSDAVAMNGESCSFPVDFTIAVSGNGSEYETVHTVTDGANPLFKQQIYSFDTVDARYVRITVTELGDSASNENPYPLYRVQLAELEVSYNSELDTADADAAAAVDALIDAIDLADAATLTAAREAYDALTEAQQALVTKLEALEEAEARYAVMTSVVTLKVTGPETIRAYDESVTYTVSAQGMQSLATVMLRLEVTDSLLAAPQIVPAEGWMMLAHTYEDGELIVTMSALTGITGTGELCTVTMKPTGETGEASVTVTDALLVSYLGDQEETFVEADLAAAFAVTQVEHNIFDVNRDGKVDLLDMTRAQRYYGSSDPRADMNGDNIVDVNDLILIMQAFYF